MKNRISNSFNRAYKTYDLACEFQDQVCLNLLEDLKKFRAETGNILDLGCGTGNSTILLTKHFPYKHIFALDIAINLLKQAKSKLNNANVSLVCADFEEIVLKHNYFDLAFSNMALQWSLSLERSIENISQQIKKDGIFAFTIPIVGTFSELPLASRNKFYDLSKIKRILILCNFKIISAKTKRHILQFSSTKEALRSIKKVGANCCLKDRSQIPISRNLSERASAQKLTYNIAYIIVSKEGDNDA